MKEKNKFPTGRMFAYDGKVTLDEHIAGKYKPAWQSNNLIPTVGRVFILTDTLNKVDEVALGDDGSPRSLGDTDLKNKLFSAFPTHIRVDGTVRYTELFVDTLEANFTHREIGVFADGTLISTLRIVPEFEKTEQRTRTYIHEMGWF